jgi:hypothetical protein
MLEHRHRMFISDRANCVGVYEGLYNTLQSNSLPFTVKYYRQLKGNLNRICFMKDVWCPTFKWIFAMPLL